MKDCVFLLADLEIRAFIEGFFNRPRFHLSLGTSPFIHDIIADTQGNDPGVYTRAHELLRPYLNTHVRAAILLDAQWDGSPGPDAIRLHIGSNMRNTGWSEDRFIVTVIDPELETWIWQDNPNVEKAFGYEGPTSLRKWLETEKLWPDDHQKPPDPKAAVQHTLKICKKRIPSVAFKRISSRVSVRKCTDDSFQELLGALQKWFPPISASRRGKRV